tara:strand:- start:597 stop:785 length:189 start_codon:yes stop_codon:yes gene_type:complete
LVENKILITRGVGFTFNPFFCTTCLTFVPFNRIILKINDKNLFFVLNLISKLILLNKTDEIA